MQAEELKQKLFKQAESGWYHTDEVQKNKIATYCQGYMQYLNESKTEREIWNFQKGSEENSKTGF